jgi:hypothetical protein
MPNRLKRTISPNRPAGLYWEVRDPDEAVLARGLAEEPKSARKAVADTIKTERKKRRGFRMPRPQDRQP